MKNKIFLVAGVIAVAILVCSGIAATSAFKKTNQLGEKINSIDQKQKNSSIQLYKIINRIFKKQEEFSSELEKIAQNVPAVDEEKIQKPEDTNEIDNENITKDWKIYRDEELRYSLKYPFFLNIKENLNSTVFREEEPFFVIKVTEEKKNNLLETALANFNYWDKLAQQTKKITEAIVNNRKSILIVFDTTIPYLQENVHSYYVENNNTVFCI